MRSQVSTHVWLMRSTMSWTVSTELNSTESSCRNPCSRLCNCLKAVRSIECHMVGPLGRLRMRVHPLLKTRWVYLVYCLSPCTGIGYTPRRRILLDRHS